MTQPSRKTLLALLRRWEAEFSGNSLGVPLGLLKATREALAPDKRTPELPGQTAIPCGAQYRERDSEGFIVRFGPHCTREAGHSGPHRMNDDA